MYVNSSRSNLSSIYPDFSLGQAHRLRQRRRRRPDAPPALLHALLRDDRVRVVRDPAEEAVPGRAGGDLDARRAPVVPAHGPLAVPEGVGRARGPRRRARGRTPPPLSR